MNPEKNIERNSRIYPKKYPKINPKLASNMYINCMLQMDAIRKFNQNLHKCFTDEIYNLLQTNF